MKYTSPLIPVRDIQPGQQFTHHGNLYVRATEEESARHPARELQQERPGIILVYMLGRQKRTPSSFVPSAMVLPR